MRHAWSIPLRLLRRATWALRSGLGTLARRARGRRERWLTLEWRGELPDLPPRRSWVRWIRGGGGPSLLEVLQGLEAAAADPHLTGLYLKLSDVDAPWSTLWEVRSALVALREAGKKVVVYAEGLDSPLYWLATAGTRLYLTPAGSLELVGLRAEMLTLKPLLARLGVEADFIQAGRYKTFAEMFTREGASPEQQETLSDMLDVLYGRLVQDVAAARGLDVATLRDLFDKAPFHARAASQLGLIDGALFEDELEDTLTQAAGGEDALEWIPFEEWSRLLARRERAREPLLGRKIIALVGARGSIEEGEGNMVQGGGITREDYLPLIDELREDDEVAGVVLRIDSPGGSALVSDQLWRALSRLREAKPLFVSMGANAASGGYYMASAAEKIFAAPGTVTGSIGVLAGKFQISGLSQELGVVFQGVERGARAGIYSMHRGFTEEERAHLQRDVDAAYELFLDRVLAGRQMAREELHAAAQGRVWTGEAALGHKLVDGLAGVLEVCHALAARLGGRLRDYELVPISPGPGPSLLPLPGARASSFTLPWVAQLLPRGVLELASAAVRGGPGARMLAVSPEWIGLRSWRGQ